MRIFIASLATETSTFAPFPTGRAAFEQHGVARSAAQVDSALSGPLRVFRKRAEADGHEVIESLSAFATPSGRTVRAVYEEYRDIILADLAEAGPVDVVLLMLHGAMVAVGYDDCEGDLIDRVRALAPDAVIGVELDPHCHLTRHMVGGADLIVIAREYPHIDFDDRAHSLYGLALATARGEIRPVAGVPLGDRRLIVVKSSNHYRAGFEPIADQLWHVGSPATMSLDFVGAPYTQIAHPMFPFDDDPWADAGRPPRRSRDPPAALLCRPSPAGRQPPAASGQRRQLPSGRSQSRHGRPHRGGDADPHRAPKRPARRRPPLAA